jgi:hypothetical protein
MMGVELIYKDKEGHGHPFGQAIWICPPGYDAFPKLRTDRNFQGKGVSMPWGKTFLDFFLAQISLGTIKDNRIIKAAQKVRIAAIDVLLRPQSNFLFLETSQLVLSILSVSSDPKLKQSDS